jgi:CHAD domain-containing protein
VQAAVVAAEQLKNLWKNGVCSKLLRRLPPAAWESTAADAASSTKGLLAALDEGLAAARSTASTDKVVEGLEQHNFSHLMAQLAVWLQQRAEVTTEHAACSSSSSSNQGTCHVTTIWSACLTRLGNFAGVLARYTQTQPHSAAPHAEHLAGAKHDPRCILDSSGQHSSSVQNTILFGAHML